MAKVPPHSKPLSARALARVVGKSASAVRKWISRRDWPYGRGPFDIALVQKWMQVHLKRDPAQRYHDAQRGVKPDELSLLDRARTANYLEAARIRELKRRQIEGQLHDVADCEARRRRQILLVRNALTRTLPRTLAAELVGRARGDMERILHSRLAAVCEMFAGSDRPRLDDPPAAAVPASQLPGPPEVSV